VKLVSAVKPAVAVGTDLAVSLAASPWDPEASSELVFTVTVSNLGKTGGSSALVKSPLSDAVAWSDGDGACEPIDGAVLCTVEPLAVGASRQLWFALEVFEPYPMETTQEVALWPTDPDPVMGNNVDRVRTILDVEAPVVEGARALFDGTARRLRACTQLATAPTRLEVTFSEAMRSGSISRMVDSAESYLLVRPGPDGVFSETSCAVAREQGLPSTDHYVKILGVDWDAASLAAEIEIEPSDAIYESSGHWRLIACGSLTDLVGNPLDGDRDGLGGDDAVIDFRVDEDNLIDNGHFDCNVDHWIAVGADAEAFVLGQDAEGDPLSTSALLESTGGLFTLGAGQCVVGPAPGAYEISALHRLSPKPGADALAPGVGAWVGIACSVFESTTCDGMTQLTGGGSSARVPSPTGGVWGKLSAKLEVPETAGSVLCTVATSGEGDAAVFEFDRVRLVPVPVVVETVGDGPGPLGRTY
jgi:hypothetical protein